MTNILATSTMDDDKLRRVTIGKLLRMLDAEGEQDNIGNWRRIEEILALILQAARCFYYAHEDNVCHDAIMIAELAVGADGINKDRAAAITGFIGWLGNSMLNLEEAEEWNAATITALKAIRNSNADIDPDDPPVR